MDIAPVSAKVPSFKIVAPASSASELTRAGLLEKLALMNTRRVIGISAPAGYGKSTLLAQFYHRIIASGGKAAWLHLDQYDDAVAFWEFFGMALSQLGEADFSWMAEAAAQTTGEDPRWLNRLINEIARSLGEFTLFIDNYHEMAAPNVHSAMSYFLRYLPANMHLVVASREEIPFITARLELQGRAATMHQKELSFSFDESVFLCQQISGAGADKSDVWAIHDVMGGWPAGIKMLALASASSNVDVAAQVEQIAAAGNDIGMLFEYLGEEVFRTMAGNVQSFLLDCAFLSELNPDLCNTVLQRDDSEDVLVKLEAAGIFLTAMSEFGSWYRIHPVFRNYLLRERAVLGLDDFSKDVMRRSADWLVAEGYSERAVPHLVACGDYSRALDIVDVLYCQKGPHNSYSRPIVQLLCDVPYDELLQHPRCAAALAISVFSVGDSEHFDSLIAQIADSGFLDRVELSELNLSDEYMAMLKGMVLYAHGKYDAAARELMEHVDLQNPGRLGGLLLFMSARCCIESGDIHQSQQLLWASIDNAETCGMHEERLLSCRELSRVLAMYGDVQGAESVLREASDYAIRHGQKSGVQKYIDFFNAVVAREWGDNTLLNEFIENEQEFIAAQKRSFDGWLGAPDFFLELAKCYASAGRADEAEECFTIMRSLIKERLDIPLLAEETLYMRLKFWLFSGREERISSWYSAQRSKNLVMSVYERRIMATARALALLAAGQPSLALEALDEAEGNGDELPVMLISIDYHILRAWALLLTDRHDAAERHVLIALRRAFPGRFVRVFAEWGAWLDSLLAKVASAFPASAEEEDFIAYMEQVRAACTKQEVDEASMLQWQRDIINASDVGLSEREREILRLLTEDRTVKEICTICGIKQSTATSHINSIYRKLGVHSRIEAIRKGAELLG